MIGLTLDTGALIAADRRDRRFWSFWKAAISAEVPVTVPAGVLAQAWRGRTNVAMAIVLKGCVFESLDEAGARAAGALCATSGTADIIDASVVLGASDRGDDVLTSDVDDLTRLADHAPGLGRIVDLAAIADD